MQRMFFRVITILSLIFLCNSLHAQTNPTFSFSAPQKVTTGTSTQAGNTVTQSAADINNDGNTDFVVNISASGYYQNAILMNNGNGGFVLTKSNLPSLTLVDTNRDGYPDSVTFTDGSYGYYDPENGCQNDYMPGSIDVWLGDGHGNFALNSAGHIETGPAVAGSVVVGDFNGDGLKDIAVLAPYYQGECQFVSPNADTLYVLLNNGDGTFTMRTFPTTLYDVNEQPTSNQNLLVSGDFNGDGKLDVAFLGRAGSPASNNYSPIQVLYGNGDGTFKVGPTYSSDTSIDDLLAADLNGDGKTDLVILTEPKAPSTQYRIATLLAKQAGGFYWASAVESANPVQLIALKDLNNDGRPDLAYYSYDPSTRVTSLRAYPGMGGGKLGSSSLLRNLAPNENDIIAPLKAGGPLDIFYALSYPPNKSVFLYEMLNQNK